MRCALFLVAVLLGAALTGLVPLGSRVPSVAAATRTFVVKSALDHPDANPGDGKCQAAAPATSCTLRAAIQEANTTVSRDAIAFAIPTVSGHPATIRPKTALPPITTRLTIDGYTQPGASPNTLAVGTNAVLRIELDGSNLGGISIGLTIQAPNVLVAGLVINRFPYGVLFKGAAASGGLIEGCFVGTDAAGTQDLGNALGVGVSGSNNITIGGSAPAARNLISGNGTGVQLDDAASSAAVHGNLIGTDKTGSQNLGNRGPGVTIDRANNATIGSNNVDATNIIAYNDGDGVVVNRGTNNHILRNSIFANGGEGIDLGDDGRTANDPLDTDDGANYLQNSPELTAATRSGGVTTITGRLRSNPNGVFVVQIFSSPSGGQGKTFRGQVSVTANANGVSPVFTFSSPTAIPVGHTVTATATDEGGDTSEFSRTVVVTAA